MTNWIPGPGDAQKPFGISDSTFSLKGDKLNPAARGEVTHTYIYIYVYVSNMYIYTYVFGYLPT